jgi:hypothetical protein
VDQSNFEVDAEGGAPSPGARQPLPWTELRIDAARVRRRKDGGSVFVVCDGRLKVSGRVKFFLTLANGDSSFAGERGVAIMRAIIEAGSEPATVTEHKTLLAAAVQQLAALRPVEVTGALVEQSGTFIPRLEIDAVRPVSAPAAEAAQ